MLIIARLFLLFGFVFIIAVPNISHAELNSPFVQNNFHKTYETAKKYRHGINNSNSDDFIHDVTGDDRKTNMRNARQNFADNLNGDDRTQGQNNGFGNKHHQRRGTTRYYTGRNGTPPASHGVHRGLGGVNNSGAGTND